ncbi:unnamed protein product [Hymenolepis diminuta]|uniref:Uncharacterized protein n=1 Tax=Hymenolepis diminuta TaxID=6216 RepID=A0A564Z1W5_HYMDI|nr:unnamed protein product [Hymenolepis diminuta]
MLKSNKSPLPQQTVNYPILCKMFKNLSAEMIAASVRTEAKYSRDVLNTCTSIASLNSSESYTHSLVVPVSPKAPPTTTVVHASNGGLKLHLSGIVFA